MNVNRHIICLYYNHFYHLYLVALNKNMNCDRPKEKLVMKNKSKHLIGQIIKHYTYVPKLSCQKNLQISIRTLNILANSVFYK